MFRRMLFNEQKYHNYFYMKTRTILNNYWQHLLIALFAIAVFCFWYLFYPHVVVGREMSQMFLWNSDYFMERVIIPGGVAQYLGEFLVQFFLNPIVGACIYTLLYVAILLLAYRLWQQAFPRIRKIYLLILSLVPVIILWYLACDLYVPMTSTVAVLLVLTVMAVLPTRQKPRLVCLIILTPVLYWLVGPAAILLALCSLRWSWLIALLLGACILGSSWIAPYPLRQLARGVDYYWEEKNIGDNGLLVYDYLLRQGKWDEIERESLRHPRQLVAIQQLVSLAQFYQQRLSQQELFWNLAQAHGVLKDEITAFMMSDVYLQAGMVNMSQRSAFEAMEAIPNHNKSGRALKRLVETSLITKQYSLALKYISLLEQTLLYREWAEEKRALAEQPERIAKHPFYGRLQEVFATTDEMFFY